MAIYSSVISIDPTDTGVTPTIVVSGDEVDIGLDLMPQGDGQVTIDNNPITTILDNESIANSSVAPGPTTLFTYALPANTFVRDGDSLWLRAAGTAASTNDFKRLQFKIGGTILFDTTNQIQNGAGNTPGGGWFLDALIMQAAGDILKTVVNFSAGFVTVTWNTKTAYSSVGTTRSSAQSFTVVAATTIADNDIVGEMLMATFLPGKV
jgi:hypothetical protein